MDCPGSTDVRIKQGGAGALDVTVLALHEAGEIDVEGSLTTEMKLRGLEISDEAWVVELAAKIPRGERVVFVGGPEDPSN